MALSLAIGTLATIGIQVATSIINEKYNRENLAELKQLQEEAKRNRLINSLQRDYDKFQRACQLQIMIELKRQQAEIDNLNNGFLETIQRMAHTEALREHYPLNISPFVINHAVIPIFANDISHARKEMFCILTNSNNDKFNKEMLPCIDEHLCADISKYWNQNSMHTICYYTNTWKEDICFCNENITNLKPIIQTPTIAITPFFECKDSKHILCIKINMWGVNKEIQSHLDTMIAFDKMPEKYTEEDRKNIMTSLYPILLCGLAYCIDAYYWGMYYQPPILPILLANNQIIIDEEHKRTFAQSYCELYRATALGETPSQSLVAQSATNNLKEIAEINLFNFPERCVDCLDVILEMYQHIDDVDNIIKETTRNYYKSCTGEICLSLPLINAKLLSKEDCDVISKINAIAKKCKAVETSKTLTDIIRRKILEWY